MPVARWIVKVRRRKANSLEFPNSQHSTSAVVRKIQKLMPWREWEQGTGRKKSLTSAKTFQFSISFLSFASWTHRLLFILSFFMLPTGETVSNQLSLRVKCKYLEEFKNFFCCCWILKWQRKLKEEGNDPFFTLSYLIRKKSWIFSFVNVRGWFRFTLIKVYWTQIWIKFELSYDFFFEKMTRHQRHLLTLLVIYVQCE